MKCPTSMQFPEYKHYTNNSVAPTSETKCNYNFTKLYLSKQVIFHHTVTSVVQKSQYNLNYKLRFYG